MVHDTFGYHLPDLIRVTISGIFVSNVHHMMDYISGKNYCRQNFPLLFSYPLNLNEHLEHFRFYFFFVKN